MEKLDRGPVGSLIKSVEKKDQPMLRGGGARVISNELMNGTPITSMDQSNPSKQTPSFTYKLKAK